MRKHHATVDLAGRFRLGWYEASILRAKSPDLPI
jgi:hypothetical protein